MKIKRIHHVAYRCNNAKETVEFYQRVMGMDFQLAIAENEVCLLYTSPSPRDRTRSRMPSSA